MVSTGTRYGYATSKGRLAMNKKQGPQIRRGKKQRGYYFATPLEDPASLTQRKGKRKKHIRKTGPQNPV